MSERISVDLGNVQKTLFLPLWGRAVESKKPSPLLVDKTALRIIDAVDYDFSTIAANINPLSQLAWIMRSKIVDEVTTAFLKRYPAATIVNIGCGLDTTFDPSTTARFAGTTSTCRMSSGYGRVLSSKRNVARLSRPRSWTSIGARRFMFSKPFSLLLLGSSITLRKLRLSRF